MTVEYLLLTAIGALIVVKAFFGDSGLPAAFQNASPKLAARIERNVETGAGFNSLSRNSEVKEAVLWTAPNSRMGEPQ